MIEIEVFIPERDEEGKHFPKEYFSAWEDQVMEKLGGLSLMPGLITGKWISRAHDVVVRDELRHYVIAVEGIVDLVPLLELVGVAKDLFAQEGIYVRYLGQGEVL